MAGYCASKELKEFKDGKFTLQNLELGKTWARSINKVGEYFQYYKKKIFCIGYDSSYAAP